eukprot:UN10836
MAKAKIVSQNYHDLIFKQFSYVNFSWLRLEWDG